MAARTALACFDASVKWRAACGAGEGDEGLDLGEAAGVEVEAAQVASQVVPQQQVVDLVLLAEALEGQGFEVGKLVLVEVAEGSLARLGEGDIVEVLQVLLVGGDAHDAVGHDVGHGGGGGGGLRRRGPSETRLLSQKRFHVDPVDEVQAALRTLLRGPLWRHDGQMGPNSS
ncbi:hypothetical protein VTK73DRAFT_3837 [Phialemonium thermophilum]|uniref:Uncharacterized protein n=1 Tax=Phialemonium thermophilum TaxID=223376 RepID=A0ABR3VEA1_9PEZI